MGRDNEIEAIVRANRAAVVGSLMLGDFKLSGLLAFLEGTDTARIAAEPRRRLRAGDADVRRRRIHCHVTNTFEPLSLMRLVVSERGPK